jgi:ATP-dependent RNA helicase TDRD9
MCDCICILNAYNVYESMKANGHFSRAGEDLKWAKKNMIELGRLREAEKLKLELESRLQHINIHCTRDIKLNDPNYSALNPDAYNIDDPHNDLESNYLILKMMIAGAFYPNYFNGIPVDPAESMRLIACRDYRNTVVVKNLPQDEAALYTKQLVDMFKPCAKHIQVHYDNTKAYIEFKSKCEEVSTNVNLGVYMAVQMRMLRLPAFLQRYSPLAAHKKLKQMRQAAQAQRKHYDSIVLSQEQDPDTARSTYKISLAGSTG